MIIGVGMRRSSCYDKYFVPDPRNVTSAILCSFLPDKPETDMPWSLAPRTLRAVFALLYCKDVSDHNSLYNELSNILLLLLQVFASLTKVQTVEEETCTMLLTVFGVFNM